MKSSFKKKETAAANLDDGSKAYFGLPEFDAIFHNSLKKGMIYLIEEDFPSNIYLYYLRYYLGSNFHSNQHSFIYEGGIHEWKSLIPVKGDSRREAEESKKAEDSGAKIAWRYDKMSLNTNPLVIANDIPKLDLSRNLENNENLEKLISETSINDFSTLRELFEHIFQSVENNLKNPNDTALRKIVIHNLFSKLCFMKYSTHDFFKFCHSLKVFIKSSFSTLLITVPPNASPVIKKMLIQTSDLAIKIQEIFGNKEFDEFQGIMHVLKCPCLNSIGRIKIETLTWGIKSSSKRRLVIEKLYQSPEKEEVHENDEKHKNQPICSSKPGGNKSLDF